MMALMFYRHIIGNATICSDILKGSWKIYIYRKFRTIGKSFPKISCSKCVGKCKLFNHVSVGIKIIIISIIMFVLWNHECRGVRTMALVRVYTFDSPTMEPDLRRRRWLRDSKMIWIHIHCGMYIFEINWHNWAIHRTAIKANRYISTHYVRAKDDDEDGVQVWQPGPP